MNVHKKRVAAKLLEIASDEFSSHGCNDFDLAEVLPDVNDRRDLMRSLHEWNGDLEEFDPKGDYEIVDDFALMSFLSHALLQKEP